MSANYQQSVVTFVDVMGFRNMVMGRPNLAAPMPCSDIVRMLSEFREFSKYDDPAQSGFSLPAKGKVSIFSDSVIRICPLDSDANQQFKYGVAFYELLDMAHLQAQLVFHGAVVRGGMTIGDAYSEDSADMGTVFGPAIIDAYDMEKNEAKFPRIIVSESLLDAIKSDPRLRSENHAYAQEMRYIMSLLVRGRNGTTFVDYVRVGFTDSGNGYEFLRKHKQLIDQQMGVADCDNIKAKYAALADYHNDSVKSGQNDDGWFVEYSGNWEEDFLIDVSQPHHRENAPKFGPVFLGCINQRARNGLVSSAVGGYVDEKACYGCFSAVVN